jgi:hypothetical protein
MKVDFALDQGADGTSGNGGHKIDSVVHCLSTA